MCLLSDSVGFTIRTTTHRMKVKLAGFTLKDFRFTCFLQTRFTQSLYVKLKHGEKFIVEDSVFSKYRTELHVKEKEKWSVGERSVS